MKQPKKELIKGIADLFEDYEETYVPGEWESFSKVKKKKYPFFTPWMKIAAVLFLMAAVLPFAFYELFRKEKVMAVAVLRATLKNDSVNSSGDDPGPVVMNRLPGVKKSSGLLKSTMDPGVEGQQSMVVPLNADLSIPDTVLAKKTKKQNTQEQNRQVQSAQTAIEYTIVPGGMKKDTVISSKRDPLSTMEFLMAESGNTAKVLKKRETGNKWDFGVQVMPIATSSNVNIGAGLITAYRLSDKFSLSSGISFLQLEAGGKISPKVNYMASISSLSDKKLLSVDADLKAIDIPIALVYKLNKHFYASAGVSYFNVISEKRSNTFELTAQIDQHSLDPQTGYSSTFKTLFTEQIAEPTSEKHLIGNSYLGFLNFSVGHQQTLFNKYNIRIEPFVKIPVGKLSSEELQLMNSGVKFQLSF